MNDSVIGTVMIKFSDVEINHLIVSLYNITSSKIPVDEEWKKPFNTLLTDLKNISQQLEDKKRGQNVKKETNKSGSSIPQKEEDCEVCD